MTISDFRVLWHTLAVGMFYRDQSAANPMVYYHWEQQPLSLKLHYQAKAKVVLKELAPYSRQGKATQNGLPIVEERK